MADLNVPVQGTEYEFNDSENAVFRELAGNMKFVGIAGVILGALAALGGLLALLGARPGEFLKDAIEGTAWLLIGLWTLSASRAVMRIVDTQGSDITNLMTAMRELKKVYRFQMIVLMIALALLLVAGVLIATFGAGLLFGGFR